MKTLNLTLKSFTASQLPEIHSFQTKKPKTNEIIKLLFSRLSITPGGKLRQIFYLSEALQYSGKSKIFYTQSSAWVNLIDWKIAQNYIVIEKDFV